MYIFVFIVVKNKLAVVQMFMVYIMLAVFAVIIMQKLNSREYDVFTDQIHDLLYLSYVFVFKTLNFFPCKYK